MRGYNSVMGELRFFKVQDVIQRFNTRAFVETGTGYGFSLYFASCFPFQQLHSIDILEDEVKRLRPAFEVDRRVQLHAGKSPDVLRQLLPTISENILFWLDAHYPGAHHGAPFDAEKDERTRLPLEDELNVIKELRGGFRDVILIDDLRIYEEDRFEWGNLRNFNLQHTGKFDSKFLYSTFEATHSSQRLLNHTGYVVLLPK